jgi:hypothetical protein
MAVIHVKSNTVADFTGTVTVGNSAGATTTIAATDLVRPSDWNSQHSVVFTLGGNTSVQSTCGGTDLRIHGAGGITVAGSTGTLVISGHVGTLLSTVLAPGDMKVPFAQSSFSIGQNSLFIFPCHLESDISADHMRMPVFVTNSSSAAASVQKGQTFLFGVYSKVPGDQTQLTRHYSTSYTIAASHNSNVSWMQSMITAIGNSTSYSTLTASSAGINLSSSLHGARELVLPISSVLSAGEWWWALHASTSSVGAGGAVLNISNLGVAYQTYNRVGQVLNSSNSAMYGQNMAMGVYSNTTAALPATINFTQVRNMGSLPILFLATGTV